MQKAAPTAGRILTMVGFALSCFALLLFLWIAFGGPVPLQPQGYRFHVKFDEATQLAQEADVRISGVTVGKVKQLEPSPRDGLIDTTIELEPEYAPLPRNAKAILRQKTLLGETYVELTPGDEQGAMLAEDATLPVAQVSPTVELDEILRTFDSRTRRDLQRWLESQAEAFRGRGGDLNQALGELAPFAEDTNDLLETLNRQERSVRGLISNTGEVFDALSARDTQLRSLIENSNRVFATTADRDRELQDTFRVLPTFQRESRVTLARLDDFARDTDPLVTQLRPAARELSPTLQDLGGLAPDLRALFRDLGPLITVSRRGLPALETTLDELRPVLGQLDPFLRDLNPALRFLGSYRREIAAFLANVPASTQGTSETEDGEKLHYLRTTNPVEPEMLAAFPRRLGSNRPNPYVLPGGFENLGDKGFLEVFEGRQCARQPQRLNIPDGPLPGLFRYEDPTLPLTGEQVEAGFKIGDRDIPATPCVKQGRNAGQSTDYPHVAEDPGR